MQIELSLRTHIFRMFKEKFFRCNRKILQSGNQRELNSPEQSFFIRKI